MSFSVITRDIKISGCLVDWSPLQITQVLPTYTLHVLSKAAAAGEEAKSGEEDLILLLLTSKAVEENEKERRKTRMRKSSSLWREAFVWGTV